MKPPFRPWVTFNDNLEKSASDQAINSLIETVKNLKQNFEIDLPNQYRLLYDKLAKVDWYIDYNLAPKTIADLILIRSKRYELLGSLSDQLF